jgi:hypothetical protein
MLDTGYWILAAGYLKCIFQLSNRLAMIAYHPWCWSIFRRMNWPTASGCAAYSPQAAGLCITQTEAKRTFLIMHLDAATFDLG